MIVMRGDDRVGLDPYFLGITGRGRIQFGINAADNSDTWIEAPIQTGRWVHVTATLDATTGAMSLYLDGQLAAYTSTSIRPFADLDPNSNPGLGIGNNNGVPPTYDYGFKGLIDEVKLFNAVVPPGT